MKLWLHHINLCSTNVPAMDEFYRSVLGLAPEPDMAASRVTTQVHLAERDLDVGFRTGQPLNPLERGHIAFRTDDIEAFKRHLEAQGIAYADYGDWAMSGWAQIFFHDPEGNVIEVHQVRS